HANLAIGTGQLVVLDIDGPAGHAALASLESAHEPLPGTLTAATARGEHRYYTASAQIGCPAGRLGRGIDVRGRGGYAIAPPSRPTRPPRSASPNPKRSPPPTAASPPATAPPAAPPPRRAPATPGRTDETGATRRRLTPATRAPTRVVRATGRPRPAETVED